MEANEQLAEENDRRQGHSKLNRYWPIWSAAAVFMGTLAIVYWASGELHDDALRPTLRWIAAPAFVLTALAGTMLGKIHDLGEMEGLCVDRIEQLRAKVRIIHSQLWLIILSIVLVTLLGALFGSIENLPPLEAIRWITMLLYALMITALMTGSLLLRQIFTEYVEFRFDVIVEEREAAERSALAKALEPCRCDERDDL